MKAFITCLFLMISSILLGQSGKVFDLLTMDSKILEMERRFAVYLPPCYETSQRSYPALYLLHCGVCPYPGSCDLDRAVGDISQPGQGSSHGFGHHGFMDGLFCADIYLPFTEQDAECIRNILAVCRNLCIGIPFHFEATSRNKRENTRGA